MWTKLGDEFADAARDLSDAAWRTHVEALIWSNRRGLDLVVNHRDLRRFAETSDPGSAVAELVDAGWWQDLEDGSYFIGCRFGDWQLESHVIEYRRQANADRQRRHRLHKAGDHSLCTDNCSVTRYKTRDEMRDPGRVGSGRDGNHEKKSGRENQDTHASAYTKVCAQCDMPSDFSLVAGLCRTCRFPSTRSAA